MPVSPVYLEYRLLADVTLCSSKTTIVEEVTTLCQHLEARHSARYHTQATSVGFKSKLPGNVKKRKEAAEKVT